MFEISDHRATGTTASPTSHSTPHTAGFSTNWSAATSPLVQHSDDDVLGENRSGNGNARRKSSPIRREPDDADLNDLLNSVAAGDAVAFAHLYGQIVHPVMALVRLLMRDVALAEEVTQDVFLAVWTGAAKFDSSRGQAKAWILAMARSRAIDRIRSTQAARIRDDHFAHDAFTEGADAGEEAQTALEQQRLHQALAVLTPLQRQAIMLAFFGGHTYPETANLLQVPLPTLKSRVREGLMRLRSHLDENSAAGWANDPSDD